MGRITLEKNRILLGCTGSVASILTPQLIDELASLKYRVEIQVVATDHAMHFFDRSSLPVRVHCDIDEWQLWNDRTDPILHIELRRWADIMVIAPLDANTMAKVANGICDNLLTCVVRAWDMERPLLFAPAMNKHMWQHPLTTTQVGILRSFGYEEIPVSDRMQLCGDKGKGTMADITTIVNRVLKNLERINGISHTDPLDPCLSDGLTAS
jgi:phosphopantothenoylcysteine decarboxylase